jgi:two-component system, OmpR family, response regulator
MVLGDLEEAAMHRVQEPAARNRRPSVTPGGAHGVVLLVGLEAAQRAVIAHWCWSRGLRALGCDTGAQALEASRLSMACAIVASAELKDGSIARFCQRVRQRAFFGPLLCVSRHEALDLESAVLAAGADDFVPSTRPERMLSRVDVALRRGSGRYSRLQQLGPLEIDHEGKSVHLDGVRVALTPTEFAVLGYLVLHHDRVVSAKELGRELLGGRMARANVKRHVSRIRAKLIGVRDAITTQRGSGYRFDLSAAAAQGTHARRFG